MPIKIFKIIKISVYIETNFIDKYLRWVFRITDELKMLKENSYTLYIYWNFTENFSAFTTNENAGKWWDGMKRMEDYLPPTPQVRDDLQGAATADYWPYVIALVCFIAACIVAAIMWRVCKGNLLFRLEYER